MAKMGALKKKGRIKEAPPTEASDNISAPETAPAETPGEGEVDGRTLRKTGRTKQIATRVTPELHKQIKLIAVRDGIKIAELLEQAVGAYERERGSE